MKIAYISYSTIPSRTANSVHVMKMCEAFAKNGHEVALFCPENSSQVTNTSKINVYKYYGVQPNFEIVDVKCPAVKARSIVYSLYCRDVVKRFEPDLIYGRLVSAVSVMSRFGVDVIYESHNPYWKKSILEKLVERTAFNYMLSSKSFKKLVVISEALKNMYLDNAIVSEEKIFVAHDAADYSNIQEMEIRWPGRSDALQVGYVGHLYPGRGIENIACLADNNIRYDFHVIGGTVRDINRCRRLQRKNLFFHGYVQPSKTAAYRSKCDVLLMPYQKELQYANSQVNSAAWMSPLKLFEYMASKKAIVSSDLPVLREVLNETNSILVDPNDLDQWCAALNQLEDKSYRDKIANQAYEDFVSNYTWDQRANKIITSYN